MCINEIEKISMSKIKKLIYQSFIQSSNVLQLWSPCVKDKIFQNVSFLQLCILQSIFHLLSRPITRTPPGLIIMQFGVQYDNVFSMSSSKRLDTYSFTTLITSSLTPENTSIYTLSSNLRYQNYVSFF